MIGELVKIEPLVIYSAFPDRKVMATCHLDRPHHAKGLCYPCYRSDLRRRNLDHARLANKRRNAAMNLRSPNKRFFYHIKSRYNLTEFEYWALLEAQDYCCAICEIPFEGGMKGPFVDHNHITNKVRGLLCPICNTFIGRVKENLLRIAKISDYIKRGL